MNWRTVSRGVVVLIMVMAMLAAVACAPDEEVEPVDEPDGKEGGVLVIGLGADPVSLDYHLMSCWPSRQAIHYMYDPLLRLNDDEELEGVLATSWDIAEDGLAYTFHLREDVKFHDGTRFDAEAVKFNFDRILDPDVGSLHLSRWEPYIDSVEVIDDFTVTFHLKTVYVDFLEQMTWSAHILSPTAVEEHGEDFALRPVGTGPFVFEEYVPDSHIKYVRNEDYWGGAPYLDGLMVRIIPEASTRIIELEAGNIDAVHGVEPKDVERLEAAGLVVERRVTPSFQMLALNLADGPTAEWAVRRAIAHAVDRQLIVDQVLLGAADLSRAGVAEASPFYTEDVPEIEYDPDKAVQLLEEAGWVMGDDGIRRKDGEPLEVAILTSDSELRILYSEIIQEQLNEIGFDADIVSLEWGTYLDAIRDGEYHVSWWSLGGFAHRIGYGTANLKSDAYWNVSQITRQPALAEVSARVDQLVDLMLVTIDYDERTNHVHEFQRLSQEHQLKVWLWHGHSHPVVQPWVKDYEFFNYAIFWLQNAWLDK